MENRGLLDYETPEIQDFIAGTRKAVNFDLDTEKLQTATHNKNTAQAYAEIGAALDRLGYDHSQYSGYVSREPKTPLQVALDLVSLDKQVGFFFEACKRCHLTVVAEECFDVLETCIGMFDDIGCKPAQKRTGHRK